MKRDLLVLLVLVFACGQDDCVEVGVVDEGFHVAEDGVELHPGVLPFAFLADETVEDASLLHEALGWCDGELSQDGVEREPLVEVLSGETPRVVVSIGYVPPPDDMEAFSDAASGVEAAGITYIDYAEDGEILGAEIVLSSDIAYDRPTLLKVLEHEALHAAFGLEDDPGPPTTVELRSAMSSPLDPLGELTEHDFLLVLPYLP